MVTGDRTEKNLIGNALNFKVGIVPKHNAGGAGLSRGAVAGNRPGLVGPRIAAKGKANQYILRGVNLDPGTDLASLLMASMPICGRMRNGRVTRTNLLFGTCDGS